MKLKILVLGAVLTFSVICNVYLWNYRYNEGLEHGNKIGAEIGFNNGFSIGYGVGYAEGNGTGVNIGYNVGHKNGYLEGNETGFVLGYGTGRNIGYNDGYSSGNQTGYNSGYLMGRDHGYDEGYQSGNVSGYGQGYAAGYDRAWNARGYDIRDPTYSEALDFVAQDQTDKTEYKTDEYTCNDFTAALKTNALNRGLKSFFVYIEFYGPYAHAIIAFNTTDRGMIFIEPQSDDVVNLRVGQPYWDRSKYLPPPYDDTVKEFDLIP